MIRNTPRAAWIHVNRRRGATVLCATRASAQEMATTGSTIRSSERSIGRETFSVKRVEGDQPDERDEARQRPRKHTPGPRPVVIHRGPRVARAEPRTQEIEPARRSSLAIRRPVARRQRLRPRGRVRGRSAIAQMDQAQQEGARQREDGQEGQAGDRQRSAPIDHHATRGSDLMQTDLVGLVAALSRQGAQVPAQADHDRVRKALCLPCRWRLRIDVEDRRRRADDGVNGRPWTSRR